MIDDDGATTTGIVAPGRHDDGFQMNDGTPGSLTLLSHPMKDLPE
jgi:hypothetical protein